MPSDGNARSARAAAPNGRPGSRWLALAGDLRPLTLPTGAGRRPAGPLAGTWQVTNGSVAGFMVRESAIGLSNYVAGQTDSVTGTMVIAGGTITGASFRVDLRTIEVNGKAEPGCAKSLDTATDPTATVSLTGRAAPAKAFISGATTTLTVPGVLTMDGQSHPVTVTVIARRNGSALQAAGTIPVSFSRWGISPPGGLGMFGSLADHGTAEFLLTLHHSRRTNGPSDAANRR
jgi:polyisoprenoid-binding protein YceI